MFEIFGAYNSVVADIIDWYDKRVAHWSNHIEARLAPWVYGFFDNGEPVTRAMRRLYRSSLDNRVHFPKPYFTAGSRSFWSHLRQIGLSKVENTFDPPRILRSYYG